MEREVTFRQAQPTDVSALLRLQSQAPESAAWGPEAYRSALADSGVTCLVVQERDSKKLAAFIVARVAADELEILNLAVTPSARRKRIGRRLVGEVLAWATQQGARRCWLEVRASNSVARVFYGSAGFVESGRRRQYYNKPEEDGVVYTRELDGHAQPVAPASLGLGSGAPRPKRAP